LNCGIKFFFILPFIKKREGRVYSIKHKSFPILLWDRREIKKYFIIQGKELFFKESFPSLIFALKVSFELNFCFVILKKKDV
jgi:hypothetical protein